MAPVITIMGPIGGGKTMQAQMLAQELGWETFSTGQLIREDSNPQGQAAAASGNLAPTGFVQDLVVRKIGTIPGNKGIILDGSPRMLPEAERLDTELPAMGRKLNLVIFLDVDQKTVVDRLAKRGRPDDHPQTIPVRWKAYERETKPVIEHYRALNKVMTVSGEGTPQQVHNRIVKVLNDANLT
jgi:adenylate kinase